MDPRLMPGELKALLRKTLKKRRPDLSMDDLVYFGPPYCRTPKVQCGSNHVVTFRKKKTYAYFECVDANGDPEWVYHSAPLNLRKVLEDLLVDEGLTFADIDKIGSSEVIVSRPQLEEVLANTYYYDHGTKDVALATDFTVYMKDGSRFFQTTRGGRKGTWVHQHPPVILGNNAVLVGGGTLKQLNRPVKSDA